MNHHRYWAPGPGEYLWYHHYETTILLPNLGDEDEHDYQDADLGSRIFNGKSLA
jgi:hypothetical protein